MRRIIETKLSENEVEWRGDQSRTHAQTRIWIGLDGCRNPENESMKEGKNEDIEECELPFQFLLMHAVRNIVRIRQQNLCPVHIPSWLLIFLPPAGPPENCRHSNS